MRGLTLFVCSYLLLVVLAAAALHLAGLPLTQWAWLTGGVGATLLTIALAEKGRWYLGLAARPTTAARELLLGAAFAAVLIAIAGALVLATTSLRHARGGGFPWLEVIAVYAPAAFHEELVFRGYPFQKLRTYNRPFAIAATSLVFAAMHAGNRGLTPLAFVNLILAGVLLALAYERYGRLWFPIGIHLAWNALTGPILGYDVSGYAPRQSVLVTRGGGPDWLTGCTFGLEGSVWILFVELSGIVFLYMRQLVAKSSRR
jgi:membrane protease YdiL (CAAX protease family)